MMQVKIINLDGAEAGSLELPDAIFGLSPRADILQRCVRWPQTPCRLSGTSLRANFHAWFPSTRIHFGPSRVFTPRKKGMASFSRHSVAP